MTAPPPGSGQATPVAPGRRDLALLTAGVAVSTAGDAAALVALQIHLTGSGAGWVAALLGAQLLPAVALAPLAGRLVDRYENRRLLLRALLAQAVIAVPLAFAVAPVAVVALFGALSAAAVVVRPATSALVPSITGEDRADRGYARVAVATGAGYIAGPVAGGTLTAVLGARAALLADAATFLVLLLACTALQARRDPLGIGAGAPEGAGRDPAAVRGVPAPDGDLPCPAGSGSRPQRQARLLRADPVLRVALGATALAVACAVVDNVAAPFRFITQLGAGPGGFGTYLALWGAGGLAGAQLAPVLGRRIGRARALAFGNALSGLGIAGIGLAPGLPVAFTAALVGGVGNGIANVAISALVAARAPAEARGRAFAAVGGVIQAAVGVGTAAGAPLVALLGADGAMGVAGCLTLVVGAGALLAGPPGDRARSRSS